MAEVVCWLESSLKRVFPKTVAGMRKSITLAAARNDQVSFQVAARNESTEHEIDVDVEVESPGDLNVRVRRVGYVPQMHLNTGTPIDEIEGIEHIPGLVPEPLWPEQSTKLGPAETQAFWVTVTVPPDAKPGAKDLRVRLKIGEKERRTLRAAIDVHPLVIQPRSDFLVGHWFHADAILDWYKIEPYERRFWDVVRPYMEDYIGHGNNLMFVPHFTPPINGEHRPHQLVKVTVSKPGSYRFDFADVRKWVRMAKSCGADTFFFSHLCTQWGAKEAVRVYLDNSDPSSLLWPKETSSTSDIYRGFLKQYLPKLRKLMEDEGIADASFVQMSDEPFGEEALANYRAAQTMVREIAPWIKTIDGLSDLRFWKEGLCDMPIAGETHAHAFAAEGAPHCVYYCCGPRGPWLNRCFETPLAKIRMSGWLFYKLRASGFAHWGYNYWYRGCTQEMLNPFIEQDYGEWPFIPYGDPFVVYPGKDGPLDSIRWEVFAESLHDYALLHSAGISPDDPLLKWIRSYEVFPKAEAWIRSARGKVLEGS